MRVLLMYPNQDLNLDQDFPFNSDDLIQDLELDVLFQAMSKGDQFLLDVIKQVILSQEHNLEVIYYRQEALKDCLKNPEIIKQMYQLPIKAKENKTKGWFGFYGWKTPSNVLNGARNLLEMLFELLGELREIADKHAYKFKSRAFTRFFEMIKKELNDEYFEIAKKHIENLRFPNGILLKVELREGNEGTNYNLCNPNFISKNLVQRILNRTKIYSFKLHPRDEAGAKILEELKNRGLCKAVTSVACASRHIENFFKILQRELAFYVSCLNLFETLTEIGMPISFPWVYGLNENKKEYSFRELYDISLALTMRQKVVTNDLNTNNKRFFCITGTNRGGKTTFLRSVGQAQLMMQAGMFVPAENFSANICSGVFTHFRREEDFTMRRGKLEEELARMSEIVDHIHPNALVLFNESFSSTNEREGSEIAHQIIDALLENDTKVFFVTHMYELTRYYFEQNRPDVIFLRAERLPNGRRTFKIKEGIPLQTSHSIDIYREVFKEYMDFLHR